MSIALATALASALGFYLVLGMLYGLYFVTSGAARMLPAAKGAGFGFRLMILPGAMLLWPILLVRLIKGKTHQMAPARTYRRVHARIWVVLIPLVALGVMMTLMLRPVEPLNDKLPKGVILEEQTS